MSRSSKRNIFEQLAAQKVAPVTQSIVKPTIVESIVINDHPPLEHSIKEVTPVELCSKLDKAITRTTAKRTQYYTILNRFLAERCEYTPGVLLDYELVRESFYQFVRDNHTEFNSIDCSFKFAPKDLIELDPRYEYKRLYYCRECTRRHFHKCCDAYKLGNRFTRYGVIGLNLKPIQNNIDDGSNLL